MQEIYDHHDCKLDQLPLLYPNLHSSLIHVPVGSACTLIGDLVPPTQILTSRPQLLEPGLRLLLCSAIVVDTNNFAEEMYETRWVDLDRKVYRQLGGETLSGLYERLTQMKFDLPSNLTLGMRNLLRKDCKSSLLPSNIRLTYSTLCIPLATLQQLDWNELVNS